MNEKAEFSKTIDDFLEGKINPTSHIFVCKTTNAMKACGAGNLDVMIYQNTIRKILSNDFNNFEHPHNLTVDTIKQLPKQLEKPVMVFKGSHEGSIVLITDLFNENNKQIIISCELASGSEWNRINRVTSMYGKENITNYLKAQIKKGNLIGCQKNIANQMLHSVGLYLPSENTFIDYTDIIPIYDKNVNINETKQFDNTLSKGESKMEDTKLNPQHNVKFMWNGIKIDGQLYKGKYSMGPYSEASTLPEGTVTIYMDTSRTPRIENLEIKNESDIMTDYFENDTVRIRPGTIHYDAAIKAANAYNIHMEKVAIRQFQKLSEKHAGSPMKEYYKQELENHKSALEKLQNPQQNNIKPTSEHNNKLITQQTFNQKQFDELLNSGLKHNFESCRFDNVNFTNKSNIDHLIDCEFQNCKFDNFSSENLEAIDSKFHNCTFQQCTLHDGNFVAAKFFDCYFYETELNNSNFTFAQIRHTSFNRETDFSAVKFHAAKMDSVYFNSCIVNKPVEGLDRNNITMGGATHQEVEVNRSIILDKLKIEPLKELNATQAEINLAAKYEAIHNIPEADKVTQISKNINIVKGNITEPIFTKRLNEALLEKSITKEQLNESAYQQQHLDKLQAIAEYEQKLNVSPKERIVEMNYSTAHWQPKDNISPDQAEAIYDYITDNQRIGFERANEIRQGVGQLPLTADKYYSNIKYMAYVSRFDFGDENSIDIEAINKALEEVPTEYVLSKMTEEQQNLFADYYEASIDFAVNSEVNLSAADQQLYEIISHNRENNLSVTNDNPITDQLSIDNISFDNDNYMHFSVDADGYRIPGYFRVFDPANGTDMEIVSIDNWDRHPIISEQWDNLTQQCRSASLEKYRELTGQNYSFSNENLKPSNNVLNKSYIQTLLNEESLWKVGESNTFSYRGENFILKKENIGNREVYSIYKDETAAPLYQYDSMETVLINFITDNQINKSIYSGEVSVYFDGDNVSITDKYNHRIKLQPADNYSYNNFVEYLNGIATIYPEYKQYIEENIAELSNNYENAIQTASDEAKSVRLAQLEADMYEGGGYGEDNANARAEVEITHLREDLNNANRTELKSNKIRFKVLEAEPITGYKYNVQVHFSHGFHENFVYSGMGRFCENPDEVKKYINKIIKEYSKYEYQFSYEDIDKNEFFKSQDDLIYNNSFSNEIFENSVEPTSDAIPHLTLNKYLAQQRLASPVDDFMIDKIKLPHGQSKYDERRMHENARKSSQEYHDKRNAAIKEYQVKVEAGEIIEPTNLERYMKTASGNPDKASVQAARRVLEKRGYTQNDNGDWVLKADPSEQKASPNTQKIKTMLEQNNELPSDVLSSKDLIKWYSFTSQINDIQATEKALQNVLKNDMQVVSVENTDNNQFRLVKLNENLQLKQFDNRMYASEKEAMNAAYSNNNIAKIVSHQNMLNSANHQSLESIARADNLKYPHVQILNSDNEFINQEDRLSLHDAEKQFSNQAAANQENGITGNAEINLFLDNINTYHFNIGLGNSGSGIINHIKQYLSNIQSEISNNQSLQTLHEYIQNNYPDTIETENVLHQQIQLTDCFDLIN